MRRAMVVFLLALVLSGCGPDPRQAAAADATRIQAEQAAADAEAARTQRAAEQALKLKEEQETQKQWVESKTFFMRWFMFFATFSVSLAASMVLLGMATGLAWGSVGAGRAASFAAALKARQIPVNPETGSFPLLEYNGNGIITLTDPNTGKTVRADTRNEADRQMIAGAFAVRLNSALAYNARKAKDSSSDGVAVVGSHPTVVGAQEAGLKVGEYVEVERGNTN